MRQDGGWRSCEIAQKLSDDQAGSQEKMSLQSFTEKLLSVIDESFAKEANTLLNEARQQTNKTTYIAGRMDGLSESVKRIKETYSLFVSVDKEDEQPEKSLY